MKNKGVTMKKNKEAINQFEKDITKAQKLGHISSIAQMPKGKGVEIFLPATVVPESARRVASFIKTKYKFQACFFIKKHTISVYYES